MTDHGGTAGPGSSPETGPAARLVIVGCGALKRPVAAPAHDLYRGPLFVSALAAALATAPRERCFILSARYGLVGLDEVIAPYDLTIGQPGAITAPIIRDQAHNRGLLGQPVTVLAPARYADLCRAVWSEVAAPLDGLGIGHQRQALARIARGELWDLSSYPNPARLRPSRYSTRPETRCCASPSCPMAAWT